MGNIVVYVGRIGETINLTLTNPDGTPVNLTSSTVTLSMYQSGTNLLIWSHTATVDDATNGLAHYTSVSGDFSTAGTYYMIVNVTYVSGAVNLITGPTVNVIQNQENFVTVDEFLAFLDIPSPNAKQPGVVTNYLYEAELLVNSDVPSLNASTDSNMINLKKTLIKFKAGMFYFLNMDENLINPNLRLEKAEFWRKEYNRLVDHLRSVTASDATSSDSIIRRVKHSDYSNPASYLYDGS